MSFQRHHQCHYVAQAAQQAAESAHNPKLEIVRLRQLYQALT